MNLVNPMKFTCKTDKWRQFRGYVFEFGKPTTVTDRATIEILQKHRDFEVFNDVIVDIDVPRETLTLPKKRGRPARSESVL